MSLEKLLIKNRKCGSCSVCCTLLRIEQPTLKKLADVPLAAEDAGLFIHAEVLLL